MYPSPLSCHVINVIALLWTDGWSRLLLLYSKEYLGSEGKDTQDWSLEWDLRQENHYQWVLHVFCKYFIMIVQHLMTILVILFRYMKRTRTGLALNSLPAWKSSLSLVLKMLLRNWPSNIMLRVLRRERRSSSSTSSNSMRKEYLMSTDSMTKPCLRMRNQRLVK